MPTPAVSKSLTRSGTGRDDGAELSRGGAGATPVRDAGLRLEDDDNALADRRRRSRDTEAGWPVDIRYVRPERDRRLLQPVQSHGLRHRHDAQPRVPPRRTVGGVA